jgi:YesN/AraC family two-component response regulator
MPDETPAALRVLLADDETIIRLDLRGLLVEHGFVVCGEARDGREAVNLARDREPDVVLMDLRMPVLDGIEAAQRIYAERPVPIVMISAYSDRRFVDRAIAAGVFSYLVKPFRESDVAPAIHTAVARHAELLNARRTAGGSGSASFEVFLPSSKGGSWPLRVRRGSDGSLEVRGL